MSFVSYQNIQPTQQLIISEVNRFHNTPKLDYTDQNNPDFGTKITNDNIYDNLLGDIKQQTKQQTKSISKIGNFNLDAAVEELHKNVGTNLKTGKSKDPKKSGHMCARAVRMAMEAGGLSTEGRPNYGGQYGLFLQKNGWQEINGDTPQKGDIAVTKPHGKHTGGHISMFDGEKWVSDYIQRDKFVYSSANDNNTTVYRYLG